MNVPTLELIQTPNGPLWRVSYAGMVKEHRQEWQAKVFYQQAISLYQHALIRRAPEALPND